MSAGEFWPAGPRAADVATVAAALKENPGPILEWFAERLVALNATEEWTMDDNFETTESLVSVAMTRGHYTLPELGGPFWKKANGDPPYECDECGEPHEGEGLGGEMLCNDCATSPEEGDDA